MNSTQANYAPPAQVEHHAEISRETFADSTSTYTIIGQMNQEVDAAALLFSAVSCGNFDSVKMVVDGGADVNAITIANSGEKTCAVVAALRHPQILQYLIDSGADVNIKISRRNTPLHYAGLHEYNLESIRILLQNGADVNAVNLDGSTPLHSGMYHKNIALFLVDNGADLNAPDDRGWKPLHLAYNRGNIDLLKELVKRGATLNDFSPEGCNALHYAVGGAGVYIKQERLRLIKWLIEEQKMNVNAYTLHGDGNRDPGGLTVWMMALSAQGHFEDDFEILEYLLSKGANINAPAFLCSYNGQYIFNSTLAWAKIYKVPRYVLEWMVQHGAR